MHGIFPTVHVSPDSVPFEWSNVGINRVLIYPEPTQNFPALMDIVIIFVFVDNVNTADANVIQSLLHIPANANVHVFNSTFEQLGLLAIPI